MFLLQLQMGNDMRRYFPGSGKKRHPGPKKAGLCKPALERTDILLDQGVNLSAAKV